MERTRAREFRTGMVFCALDHTRKAIVQKVFESGKLGEKIKEFAKERREKLFVNPRTL